MIALVAQMHCMLGSMQQAFYFIVWLDLAARGFVWTGLSAWIAKDALRPAMGKSNATVLAERLRRRGASRKEAGEASQLAAIAPVSEHANVHNKA